MESAKEKAIKEAWAEHYDFVKVNLESDGSFWVYEYQTELYEWCKKNTKRIITTKTATRFIPFSIIGVHDNNGWTRIESEAHLPTEEDSTEYFIIDSVDGFIYSGVFYQGSGIWNKAHSYFTPTHYQVMNFPQPPIY